MQFQAVRFLGESDHAAALSKYKGEFDAMRRRVTKLKSMGALDPASYKLFLEQVRVARMNYKCC
jgi:hypothetical protein